MECTNLPDKRKELYGKSDIVTDFHFATFRSQNMGQKFQERIDKIGVWLCKRYGLNTYNIVVKLPTRVLHAQSMRQIYVSPTIVNYSLSYDSRVSVIGSNATTSYR